MEFKKLLIVIPTRNRVDLAINAINSVLNQKNCNFELIISDNSTEKDELIKLKSFCDNLNDERLKYIRPPEPLSMPEHWEWAKNQALEDLKISHLCFLTDRMIYRKNIFEELILITKNYPNKIITYNIDSVDDLELPVILRQNPWTGHLFEINSEPIIKISSNSVWHNASPRMLNSVVPRNVLLNIYQKYGKVFDSISPDFCFLYKFLDTEENFLHFDKSLVIEYGMKRSNGNNYGRGVQIKDTNNFFNELAKKNKIVSEDSPVPEFHTVINGIVNEYCYVRKQTKDSKLLPLKMIEYFKVNRHDFSYIENSELKKNMFKIYEEKIKEYNFPAAMLLKQVSLAERIKKSSLKKILSGMLIIAESRMSDGMLNNLFFRMNGKYTKFNSVEDAIRHSNYYSIAKRKGMSDLEYLLDTRFVRKEIHRD